MKTFWTKEFSIDLIINLFNPEFISCERLFRKTCWVNCWNGWNYWSCTAWSSGRKRFFSFQSFQLIQNHCEFFSFFIHCNSVGSPISPQRNNLMSCFGAPSSDTKIAFVKRNNSNEWQRRFVSSLNPLPHIAQKIRQIRDVRRGVDTRGVSRVAQPPATVFEKKFSRHHRSFGKIEHFSVADWRIGFHL